jgi:hypothetical protein
LRSSNPAILSWEAEAFRASGLFPPGVTLAVAPLWHLLLDQSPEQVIELPQQGARQEAGSFGHGQLVISQTANRVDLIYAPKQAQPSGPVPIGTNPALQSIGEFEASMEEFKPIVQRWLGTAKSIGRLAFAPTLLHKTATVREGYEKLARLLPYVKVDPDGSSEMVWQINRKRPSKVLQGKNINRLSKWGLIQLRMVGFAVEQEAIFPVSTGAPQQAVRVELDFNTEDINDPIPPEALVPLFSELCDMAQEISKVGDCP